MKFNQINHIFFLGIGGIGMSAIARYFLKEGKEVHGYDRSYTRITNDLEELGASIIYEDSPSKLSKQPDLVVRTPAVPSDSALLLHFNDKKVAVLKRSEVLGLITKGSQCIAIAGTHGKTSISTLIAHILIQSNKGCKAFLGGISKNYSSNFLHDDSSNLMVVEADEFDRSFLKLFPAIALVSSTDSDHLDIYGEADQLKESYNEFLLNVQPEGIAVIKKGLDLNIPDHLTPISYSINEAADYFATNIYHRNGVSCFNLNYKGERLEDIELPFPGIHNVENAVGASAVCMELGVSEEEIRVSLRSFSGIERRFNLLIHCDELVMIDDYAHHPTELSASIQSAKALFPGKKITGIFQPHLYSRTRDFADEFATSLNELDELLLLDIYPAREKPIEGITSQMLLEKVVIKNKKLVKKTDLTGNTLFKDKHLQVLMTLGAGDIGELVLPLAEDLKKIYQIE